MTDEEMQLRNVDPEDIEDMLPIMERSFGIKFTQKDLVGVITFGQLCDVVMNTIDLPHDDGCTKQQAFYKLRQAIVKLLGQYPPKIVPSTNLADVLPKKTRRAAVNQLEKSLGFPLRILKPKPWVINLLVMGLIFAVLSLIFFIKTGLIASVLLVCGVLLANHFGKDLTHTTLGDLAACIAREEYRRSRRHYGTINKHEVAVKIKELFVQQLGITVESLTRDAIFV